MKVMPEDVGIKDLEQIDIVGDGYRGRGGRGRGRGGFGRGGRGRGGPSYDIAHEYNCATCFKLV